jgi:hypothetical protein
MFIGMLTPVHANIPQNTDHALSDEWISELALEFNWHILKDTFMPAQV